jgi:hypothetical protein
MYRVQFMNDIGLKQIAYIIANSCTEAAFKVDVAYPSAVITSVERWPYDMVVF